MPSVGAALNSITADPTLCACAVGAGLVGAVLSIEKVRVRSVLQFPAASFALACTVQVSAPSTAHSLATSTLTDPSGHGVLSDLPGCVPLYALSLHTATPEPPALSPSFMLTEKLLLFHVPAFGLVICVVGLTLSCRTVFDLMSSVFPSTSCER